MMNRHRFRPTLMWPLEDRLVLSTGGGAAVEALAPPTQGFKATFYGEFTTALPTAPGAAAHSSLVGTSSIRTLGPVTMAGNLTTNGALRPPLSNTSGTLTFKFKSHPGVLTLNVDGPSMDLAPHRATTTDLTFTVASATGEFSAAARGHGTIALTMKANRVPKTVTPLYVAPGHFKMTLVEG